MFKKLFFFAMLIAAICMASCSTDEELSTATKDSNVSTVTFTVTQPTGVQTRAYSDGTTATTLYYAVYQVTDDGLSYVSDISEADGKENAFDDDLQATVTLNLVNGNEYDVVFWAQSPDAEIYELTLNSSTPSVSIDINNGLVSNTEDYDAFYKFHEVGVVTGDIEETIELTRPFAQLNWGTNDLDAVKAAGAGYTTSTDDEGNETTTCDLQTTVTISANGVGNKLSFEDGEVTFEEDEVAFAINTTYGIPEDETFPVVGYEYLNMNYILFASDKGLVDATLTVTGTNISNTVEVSQVPLQRNYRTNIYGSLLTSTVLYTVEIVPEYEVTDYDVPLDTVCVSTASEFAAAIAAAGDDDITIVLEEDIDSTDYIIDTGDGDIVIDLNGNTLTANSLNNSGSLTINGSTDEEGNPASKLVLSTTAGYAAISTGANSYGTLTISDVAITDNTSGKSGCTILAGSSDGTSANDTIKLTNTTISTSRTGIIVYGNTNIVIVDSCTITHGYFGITQQGTNLPGTSFTVTNTTISGTYSGIYLSSNANAIYNTLTVDNCNITSDEESAIEVKKCNLTVTNSTLKSNATTQSYSLKGNGSNGVGFGIVLAGYTSGVEYEGDVDLSNITYELSATSDPDGSTPAWNVCYYDGSGAAQWEDDGAVESDDDSTEDTTE